MNLISKYNFDEAQKKEIKLGLEKELNISIYANLNLIGVKMLEIRFRFRRRFKCLLVCKSKI